MSHNLQPCTLITGASSGLGQALALELGKLANKQSFILIGRNIDSIEQTAKQLRKADNIAYSLCIDLCNNDASKLILSFLETNHLCVSTLYNNAGIGYHGDFCNMTKQQIENILLTNINSLVFLTHMLLPQLLSKKGKIINIASVYAGLPVPHQVIYAASKSFLQNFSLSLASEYHHQGLSISCVYPGSIATSFRKRIGIKEKNSAFTMQPEIVASIIIDKVKKNKLTIIPGWHNRLFVYLNRVLPIKWLTYIVPFLIYKLRRIQTSEQIK